MGFKDILVAPAAFKGLLSAVTVASSIRDGVLRARPDASVTLLPMADGGSSTVRAVYGALGGDIREVDVNGPNGRVVRARYVVIDEGLTAVIEMCSASGLALVPKAEREPFRSSTRGVGQLILDAVSSGCRKVIIGLGDSATIDIGCGMAAELGVVFANDRGERINPVPENFSQISRIDIGHVRPELSGVEFVALSDVVNPVLGPGGTVHVFGAQKGVTEDEMPQMEEAIEDIIEIMESEVLIRLRDEPMMGAAGGLGAGVKAFLNASVMRGAPAIARLIGLEVAIQNSDLVFTGEGRLDAQSFSGKAVSEVAQLAVNNDKPCWAVIGRVENVEAARHGGIEKVIEISHRKKPSSAEKARELIAEKVKEALSVKP